MTFVDLKDSEKIDDLLLRRPVRFDNLDGRVVDVRLDIQTFRRHYLVSFTDHSLNYFEENFC